MALFCASRLPEVIKSTEAYRSGELATALRVSFLALDRLIESQEGIRELQGFARAADKKKKVLCCHRFVQSQSVQLTAA